MAAVDMSPALALDLDNLTPDLCGAPDVLIEKDNVSTVDNAYYDKNGPLYQPPKPLWPGLDGGAEATAWTPQELTFGNGTSSAGKYEISCVCVRFLMLPIGSHFS